MHNHFVWGAALGILIGLAGMILLTLRLWESRREVKRLQRHLADKLELEADATNRLKTDLQQLKQQNENLRIKVASLGQLPDRIRDGCPICPGTVSDGTRAVTIWP